jgi:hypothetical protein
MKPGSGCLRGADRPAGLGGLFEDGDGHACLGEAVRRRQAVVAGADDEDSRADAIGPA